MGATRRIRIGIDTGGTFTDVVAVDEDTGELTTTKTPSTPADPAEGFIAGIEKVLQATGLTGASVSAVSHGTTVATNKLLEEKVENLGFITTEGYLHMLEIARQSVPDGYGNSYFWVKPDRIVPVDLVRTVGGRLAADGSEVRPLDIEDVVAAARYFRDRGITSIGVSLLHSYANPAHEEHLAQIIAGEYPQADISLSSRVLREYREYERSVTTLVDAAVKPNIRTYVTNISAQLHRFTASSGGAPESDDDGPAGSPDGATAGGGPGSDDKNDDAPPPSPAGTTAGAAPRGLPFYVMKSNGGVLSAEEVVHQPITTVLSGPAAGALGAAVIARRAGFPSVLTLDGGGTSTDVSVVLDGHPALTTEGHVGPYPSKIPMIDVVTVGAGGGSVAHISPEGTLKVGPRSAGADPGPMCYAQGGTEPTITDAHVILGRIPPHLLGGEIPLDVESARSGVADLAARLGLGVEEAARGILEISAWNQANALRQVTVQRGLDARDFPMVTFGGSGSLLACRLVDILGLRGIVVPPNPGNTSAYGLLTVDVRNDYVQTAVARHDNLDTTRLQQVLDQLATEADDALAREGFDPADRRFERSADLRYFGQAFEVRVPVPDGPVDAAFTDAVAQAFHAEHRSLYGYDFRGDDTQQVEWVNLRVTGVGPIRKPEAHRIETGRGAERAVTSRRPVYFSDWHDTPVIDRHRLGAGDTIEGPAVFEEFSATVPLHPGFAARVDDFGNLIIARVEDAS
ncbi:hydantoinase/oxoprolinase family protein [Pseudactinotalea sp. Z1739]|uniref:hydantoinase/oxoprolinase family protein n=1 Tax=Pseudactinotalea sp. Z1739 TaxID=3413028 RepID=UPI003C7A5158